jgi:hypothetical protein
MNADPTPTAREALEALAREAVRRERIAILIHDVSDPGTLGEDDCQCRADVDTVVKRHPWLLALAATEATDPLAAHPDDGHGHHFTCIRCGVDDPLAARVAELRHAIEQAAMWNKAPGRERPETVAAWLDKARALLPSADGSRVERCAFDEADAMCPNCQTPWKCNGPHLSDQTPWALRQTGGDA